MADTPAPPAVTVLLVDDERALREPLVDYLVGLDHTYPSAYLPRPEGDDDVDGDQ